MTRSPDTPKYPRSRGRTRALLPLLLLLAGLLAAGPGAEAELTAVWANTGEDKVTRGDLRASLGGDVTGPVWDGSTVRVFGARNELVAFVLVLEAATTPAPAISVELDGLVGPGGATIASIPAAGNGVFDWVDRPVELFLVRYLQIRGTSSDLHYDSYDERHVPERFRRPWTGEGDPLPGTGWPERPDADAFYPEIAVPLELVGAGTGIFDLSAGRSQSVWVDVYVPRDAPAGLYRGTAVVRESAVVTREIPVELTVFEHTLPDEPTAGAMVYLGLEDVADRYAGEAFPACDSAGDLLTRRVRDRHFQLAHRHRLSLIDTNDGACAWELDQPRPEWIPRLDGTLFTAANGYAGPGEGVGNGVFSIGTYGSWSWQGEGETSMRTHTDAWESWFQSNAPGTERFLYLADEPGPGERAQVEQWAGWIEDNPGPGGDLMSFCTIGAPDAVAEVPSLDVPASWFTVGPTAEWEAAVAAYRDDPSRRAFLYNGNRPAGGSFATEDDGVALRVQAWAAWKKQIDRWFFWESTYYDNFQGNTGQTNVFQQAQTFGDNDGPDPIFGESGWNYGNGDGVLFYPGTDTRFPGDSYGVEGPFASLRLKHWRRGLQDVEYLSAAAAIAPAAVDQIVADRIPEVLWEVGVTELEDPTYVLTDISWSTDPEDWEGSRCELARILDPGLDADCESTGIFADGFEAGDASVWD